MEVYIQYVDDIPCGISISNTTNIDFKIPLKGLEFKINQMFFDGASLLFIVVCVILETYVCITIIEIALVYFPRGNKLEINKCADFIKKCNSEVSK